MSDTRTKPALFENYRTGMVRQQWRNILMRDVCVYCGGRPKGLDHIKAKTRGGADGWENRAPACKQCDQHKGNAPLLVFLVRSANRRIERVEMAPRIRTTGMLMVSIAERHEARA